MARITAVVVTLAVACGGLTVAEERPAAAEVADVAYASNGPSGTVYRLYRAYFLRQPDAGGYAYWTGVYAQGYPLGSISNDFARSQEFTSRYGSVGDRDFVRLVYENVLGRAPDDDGFRYWTDHMRAGMPRGHVMIYFSDSAEFRTKTASGTPPGTTITIHNTSEITGAQIVEVQTAIIAARRSLGDRAPALVYVSSDPDAYAPDYARHFDTTVEQARQVLAGGSIGGTSQDRTQAIMFMNGATIFQRYASHKTAWVTSAHEAVHTIQHLRALAMGRPADDGTSTWGPMWIPEGHADHRGWRLAVAAGAHPEFDSWERLRAEAIVPYARRATGSLAELRGPDDVARLGVDEVYAKSVLAAEWLTTRVGADSLDRRYWQELASGKPWKDAFAAAFGMPVETFYRHFDAWAASGYPALSS